MKKLWLLLSLLLLLAFAVPIYAQQGAQLTITSAPTATNTTGPYCTSTAPCTAQIYRAVGSCPASGIGTLTYTEIASALAGTAVTTTYGPGMTWAYTDPGPLANGTYCYYSTATFTSGGGPSGPSGTFQKTIASPPVAPTMTGK